MSNDKASETTKREREREIKEIVQRIVIGKIVAGSFFQVKFTLQFFYERRPFKLIVLYQLYTIRFLDIFEKTRFLFLKIAKCLEDRLSRWIIAITGFRKFWSRYGSFSRFMWFLQLNLEA